MRRLYRVPHTMSFSLLSRLSRIYGRLDEQHQPLPNRGWIKSSAWRRRERAQPDRCAAIDAHLSRRYAIVRSLYDFDFVNAIGTVETVGTLKLLRNRLV